MATAKKSKGTPKKPAAKARIRSESSLAKQEHRVGVKLGIISLTLLAIAFLFMVLAKYQ